MPDPITRRSFSTLTAGVVLGSATSLTAGDEKQKAELPKAAAVAVEAPFTRDYAPPGFKPSWKKPQINRLLVQDFVIYAHSELDMVKKLLAKEPALLNATMDWGQGDWESGLGGASHMGRRDIVELLLGRGARIDLFCAAMMGLLDAVKSFLTLAAQPDRRQGPTWLHAALPRPGRWQGSRTRSGIPAIDQEDRAQAKPVPQEAVGIRRQTLHVNRLLVR